MQKLVIVNISQGVTFTPQDRVPSNVMRSISRYGASGQLTATGGTAVLTGNDSAHALRELVADGDEDRLAFDSYKLALIFDTLQEGLLQDELPDDHQ